MQAFNSVLEAFEYWEKLMPDSIFLKQPIDGEIIEYSFAQVGMQSRKIANALKEYNLPARSHVALLSKNCAHWHMADLAIIMAGHISIPIYPSLNAESINQILVHSESKAMIIGKMGDLEAQKKGFTNIPQIAVNLYGANEGGSWESIVGSGKEITEAYQQKPDDLYTIIYTSGTTGTPKGVMHTVENFMMSANGLIDRFEVEKNCKLFSYLPIAHVAERLLENMSFLLGSTVSFPETLQTFAADLEDTQPSIFFGVPRIWTKFQEKILEKLPQKKLNLLLKIPIVNNIIRKKLQQKLGLLEAKSVFSGAAPIAASLVNWYESIGISILQIYGMTEDCCISHSNGHGANIIGTVGKVMPNAQVKLSEAGEICIKNKCMMKGYYKDPENTAAVFDEAGFFKTGDIGEYDHDGFLTITGRIKDQFKTDKGKYISPAALELEMSKNTDVEQICIVGTGIPQPIALVNLSESGKAKSKEALSAGLIATIKQVNPKFEKHEWINKVVIMTEEWNVDNGLTTPTLKVKRNSIERIHQPYYKNWFESNDTVIFE